MFSCRPARLHGAWRVHRSVDTQRRTATPVRSRVSKHYEAYKDILPEKCELKRKNSHQYGERIDEGFVTYCHCCDGRRVVEPAHPRLPDEQRRLGAAGYVVAASGVAITPSCCIMLIWSNSRHVSTILPLAIWSMIIAGTATCLPVGGMPIRSPVWVPW